MNANMSSENGVKFFWNVHTILIAIGPSNRQPEWIISVVYRLNFDLRYAVKSQRMGCAQAFKFILRNLGLKMKDLARLCFLESLT